MTRAEKIELLIVKSNELQRIWGNPSDEDDELDRETYKSYTDEEIDEELKETTGQIKFEKTAGFFGSALKFVVLAFVWLGIAGLLVFGISQLF